MATTTKKRAKRLLPKVLHRYRSRIEKNRVIRKRDAHDSRLPENRLAKLRAKNLEDRRAAATKAITARLRGLPKEVTEADVKAPVSETVATETTAIAGV